MSETDLYYDIINTTTNTSWSYRDNSLRNDNIYVRICNITDHYIGRLVDLAYASESGNITYSLLEVKPMITSIKNNCALVDIDISSHKALYPAIPFILIYNFSKESYNITQNISGNITNITLYRTIVNYEWFKVNQTMNGSYEVGVDVDDIGKNIYIKIQSALDDMKRKISPPKSGYVIITIKNSTNHIIGEGISTADTPIKFNYMFKGRETVYVNGIPSLKIKLFNPCGIINETGYYILNFSKWNHNDTCIIVENISNVVINFANKTIDGDKNLTYQRETCAVLLRNAANITLQDIRVEQFRYGVCIFNSTGIKIIGTHASDNIQGIYMSKSKVKIIHLLFSDKLSEIFAINDSFIKVERSRCSSANFSINAKDVLIKSVDNPPPNPEGLEDIEQWLFVNNTNTNSWAIIMFDYTLPLPNNVVLMSVIIYKTNATQINGTWTNDTWQPVATIIDTINRKISTGNVTEFSIFAPFGEKTNITQPVPTPQPTPRPTPTPATTAERKEYPPQPAPPLVDLQLEKKEITLQQGESGRVKFNITNLGEFPVFDVIVRAEVRRGWDTADIVFDKIEINETKDGFIYLTVYENEIPGEYIIAVKAIVNNLTADIETLKVRVIPREKIARMEIVELAPILTFVENSVVSIPVLVKNTGDFDLTNITLTIENAERCIEWVNGSSNLSIGEQKPLVYKAKTKSALQECRSVFVLISNEGAVAYSPIIIRIVPFSILMLFPEWLKITHIVFVIWSIILIYLLRRKR